MLYYSNLLFYKTSYLNEEVNCTEPSPSVSVPWIGPWTEIGIDKMVCKQATTLMLAAFLLWTLLGVVNTIMYYTSGLFPVIPLYPRLF
jgi:hypothetical protein